MTDKEVKENVEVTEESVEEVVENEGEKETTPSEDNQLETLTTKVSELEDQNLRLQAEIVNMRTRNQKEREVAAKYRSQDLAKELLPAIDNLERALEADIDGEQGEALKKGVQMVLDNLKHALKTHGIEEIEALNQTFDPNYHQAVQTVPVQEGMESGTVVEVFQKGYQLHDRVLRPSMVVVAQ